MQIRLSVNNQYSQIDTSNVDTLARWLAEQFMKMPGHHDDFIRLEVYPTYTPEGQIEDWNGEAIFNTLNMTKVNTPEEFFEKVQERLEYMRAHNADSY